MSHQLIMFGQTNVLHEEDAVREVKLAYKDWWSLTHEG